MQPVFANTEYSSQSSFPSNDGFYSAGAGGMSGGQMGGGFGSASGSGDFGSGGFGDASGSMGGSMSRSSGSGSVFDDEPPLLEELGINFHDIWSRTLSVSLPFRPMPTMAEDDADLAGPLVFCLLLGTCLLMTGKVHFGYIYGFGVVGCLLMYVILNLMSDEAISVDRTMSILGYSLLPIVLLAVFNIFIDLRGSIGLLLSLVVIGWCTLNATRLFEKALSMSEQRYLVAYPVTMLYACFALLTIF
jgi:hypothetical protein